MRNQPADVIAPAEAGVREIGEAEAAVILMKNEAQNKLGSNVIDFELAKQRIATMPAALGEMVKPIANLKDVRILHTGGAFGGNGNGAGGGNVGFGEGRAGELLRVHALKPLIDEILVQSGFKPGDDPVQALAGVIMPEAKSANGAAKIEPLPVAAPSP